MSRFIDADRLISEISKDAPVMTVLKAEEIIQSQPTVATKKGRWLWELADNGWADHICSECGYTKNTDIHISLGWRYCPNCGAYMGEPRRKK